MGIFKKGSMAYGIFNFKCPRCHEGTQYPQPFNFGAAFKMKDNCSHCQQTYLPEPGFYYGSMFISYIMTSFFCIVFVSIAMFGFGMGVNQAFGWLIFVLIILFVYIFRISRSLWLCFNVKYDGKYSLKEPK